METERRTDKKTGINGQLLQDILSILVPVLNNFVSLYINISSEFIVQCFTTEISAVGCQFLF